MRRRFVRFLQQDLPKKVNQTPLCDSETLRRIYNRLLSVVYPSEACWISYDGYQLLIDPSRPPGDMWYDKGERAHEQYVRDVMQHYLDAGATAVDVGSCFGTYMLSMRREVGESGKVYAFEPDPTNSDFIRQTIRKNGFENVELVQAALFASTGEKSFYRHPHAGKGTVRKRPVAEYMEEQQIRTISLCDFLEERKIDKVDFVKLDIEGEEANVIKSLDSCITDIGTIVVEVHYSQLSATELDDMLSTLQENGETYVLEEGWTEPADSVPLDDHGPIEQKEYLLWRNA